MKLRIIGHGLEDYGYVDVAPSPVEWEYNGPDPDGEIAAYLALVESKDHYIYDREGTGTEEGIPYSDSQLRSTIGRRLQNFDPIWSVHYE